MANVISLSILVVEDEPFQLCIIQRLLEGMGHDVATAHNGFIALEKMKAPYDLVLMDIGLPDGPDGIEITARIRAQGLITPIVAITAYLTKNIKEHCFDVGVNTVITKPITQEKLATIIENICV